MDNNRHELITMQFNTVEELLNCLDELCLDPAKAGRPIRDANGNPLVLTFVARGSNRDGYDEAMVVLDNKYYVPALSDTVEYMNSTDAGADYPEAEPEKEEEANLEAAKSTGWLSQVIGRNQQAS